MPDLNSALSTITRFADHPPIDPAPEPEIERRAGALRRRRRARRSSAAALVLVVGLAAGAARLGGADEGPGRTLTTDSSPATDGEVDPAALIDQVIDTIEQHAYHLPPGTVAGWRERAPEVAAAATATTSPGGVPGDPVVAPDRFIELMLGELQRNAAADLGTWDGASYRREQPSEGQTSLRPMGEVRDGVGYLTLLPISAGPTTAAGADYIATAHDALGLTPCGWVIDVRALGSDVHSDLGTMLAALAPLLGPGPAVGYRDRDGATHTYVVGDDGALTLGDEEVAPAHGDGVSFTDVPVALLQGPATRWSWEAVVIGFRGRPGVRTFGAPTGGHTIVTERFPLDDGSFLVLTTGMAVDRDGTAYDGVTQIAPGESHPATAAQTEAATSWLAAEPSCAAGPQRTVGDQLEDLTGADSAAVSP
jgi:hypothetical protein